MAWHGQELSVVRFAEFQELATLRRANDRFAYAGTAAPVR